MQLGRMGMKPEEPIFIRIFKEESELEVWKQREDGRFYHFKTYPICNWSGTLGPKLKQGDRQAPEGFYTISHSQMNPNSKYYLAFNLGFPNAFDRANGRTGSSLMVHGKCKSAGCYAMTDALIEEIYGLARESFSAGHPTFEVHAYPFRMTDANMARHRKSQWFRFWTVMKQGYDYFEARHTLPPVTVCGGQYHVNTRPVTMSPTRLTPLACVRSLSGLPSCRCGRGVARRPQGAGWSHKGRSGGRVPRRWRRHRAAAALASSARSAVAGRAASRSRWVSGS
ncbi:MAG: L,D-transpeptidase family protein [Hyphomicrobiaceae bacterium]